MAERPLHIVMPRPQEDDMVSLTTGVEEGKVVSTRRIDDFVEAYAPERPEGIGLFRADPVTTSQAVVVINDRRRADRKRTEAQRDRVASRRGRPVANLSR